MPGPVPIKLRRETPWQRGILEAGQQRFPEAGTLIHDTAV